MKHPVLKVIALFSAASAAFAQPASTTAKPAASSDEVIKLSEFNVSSARASGYRAQNAITATGLGANVLDVPVTINVLTGEFFPSARQARPAALYVTGGLGNTHLAGQSLHALNIGFGARVFLRDSATLQLDVRDHIFALDVLGARRSLQNLEVTFGASFFF